MFEAEVARGVALLDEHEPGWRQRIDVQRLDMSEPTYSRRVSHACGCVLAQLDPNRHGLWDDGWYEHEAMRLMRAASAPDGTDLHDWAVVHGFTLRVIPHADDDAATQWSALTEAWRRALAQGPGRATP